jgi:hypothetical protein
MLTQLSTVKSRLSILDTDTTNDALLTASIQAVSSRFDRECSRTLARTENANYEFDPEQTELCPPCYPIESVTRFEFKTSESAGWQEITPAPDYLIRKSCVISLVVPFRIPPAALRIQYFGGYVLPGTTPDAGQTPLPPDLEQAAVEQVAYWFQNREKLGAIRYWPKGGVYEQFADLDLLPSVRAVLYQYRRWQF